MMEALSSSETSVLTGATWHNIPEDAILHSHRRENLKSYKKPANFHLLMAGFLLNIFFNPEERSSKFLPDTCGLISNYVALQCRQSYMLLACPHRPEMLIKLTLNPSTLIW
jgi:hypothetical protein